MEVRALARRAVLRVPLDLAGAIRGTSRSFGLTPRTTGGARAFAARVRAPLDERPGLRPLVLPAMEAWRTARRQAHRHDRAIRAIVRSPRAVPAARRRLPGWAA